MKSKNFRRIIESTPPEVRQKVVDMMDKLDKEAQIKSLISQGIREHLVITSEVGVMYAVEKIYKLLQQDSTGFSA